MNYQQNRYDNWLNDQKIDIILKKSDIKRFIDLSEEFGKNCKNKKITTSKIRSIFDSVKKLKSYDESKNELYMLLPKLAYAKGKDTKHTLDEFQEVMDKLIRKIDSEQELKNFKDFFEAVIAYHRAEGGK